MMPAAEFLRDGGMQQYLKDNVLRFYLVATSLDEQAGDTGEIAAASSALARVADKPASEIARHASSFFWYHVDRLYGFIGQGTEIPKTVLTLFLVQLFDSFHPVLADGDSVRLSGLGDSGDVPLPCLGLRLPAPGQIEIHRVDRHRVAFQEGEPIDVRESGRLDLRSEAVATNARLLFDVDRLIVDPVASEKLADLSVEEGVAFAQMLRDALKMVQVADAELAERIDRLMDWYFPIKTPDKRRFHNSFTISNLKGAMFLSEAYALLPLVEALVHEYYHNELWLAMRVEPHVAEVGKEDLYSPWRVDARPITGLYHGTYVFTGLLEFFAAALATPALAAHHTHFQGLLRRSYYQVRIALDQFPPDRLTARGQEYVARMTDIAERHGDTLRAAGQGVPESLLKHWQRWSETYPDFSRSATPPTTVAFPDTVAQGGR